MGNALGEREYPSSQVFVVAIGSFEGFNEEDAKVMKRQAMERGLGRSAYTRTYRDTERCGGESEKFGVPDEAWCQDMKMGNYSKLNPLTGLPDPGTRLMEGDVIIGKYATYKQKGKDDEIRDRSTLLKRGDSDVVVTRVIMCMSSEHERGVKIVTRQTRVPERGDKFTSRHGQKGTIGRLVDEWDMPLTAEGIVPDVILNPHMMPSRMTIGELLELAAGKAAALRGCRVDGTPFREVSVEEISAELTRQGYPWNAKEVFYDGITGRKFRQPMACGLVSKEKLKHMVADKIHQRARGKVQLVTGQPVEGRSRNGGGRFGEMERDCVVGHGAAMVVRDRLFLCSDGQWFMWCPTCGTSAERVPDEGGARADYVPSARVATGVAMGPMAPTGAGARGRCRRCDNLVSAGLMDPADRKPVVAIKVPKATVLLQHELGAVNVQLTLHPEVAREE